MTVREEYSIDRLQQLYHDGVIDGVGLVAADDEACDVCRGVTDRVYLPSQLPAVPVAGCDRGPTGCRCRHEPSFTVYE